MVIRLFIFIGVIFLAAFIGFQIRNNAYQAELEKARLLAQIVAQKNILPLQNNLESLLTLEPVSSLPNVEGVFLLDAGGKKVAGWEKGASQKGNVRIEETMIGFDRRPLGKVILVYRPVVPAHFLFLSLLVCLSAFLPLFRPLKRSPVFFSEDSYPWLPVVEALFGKKLYIFDEEGILLSSNGSDQLRHLLDLIPEPDRAQGILKSLEQGNNRWSNSHGKNCFLLTLD